jgi:predicted ester cyclase
MPNKNSTLTYRWMQEVWNNGREDAIDEMMDSNAEIHGIDDIKEKGTAGFKQFFRNFKSQFPKLHVEVEDVVTENNCETSRCTVDATNASGQTVQFGGMTCVKIDNGKIIEGWNNFDFMTMYQQLGFKLAPPAEEITA